MDVEGFAKFAEALGRAGASDGATKRELREEADGDWQLVQAAADKLESEDAGTHAEIVDLMRQVTRDIVENG